METDEAIEMLRARTHDLRTSVDSALHLARSNHDRLNKLEVEVNQMRERDEIERQVKAQVKHARTVRLSSWQRTAITLAAVVSIGDFILTLSRM